MSMSPILTLLEAFWISMSLSKRMVNYK